MGTIPVNPRDVIDLLRWSKSICDAFRKGEKNAGHQYESLCNQFDSFHYSFSELHRVLQKCGRERPFIFSGIASTFHQCEAFLHAHKKLATNESFSLKGVVEKATWPFRTDEIDRLQNRLNQHASIVNVLLHSFILENLEDQNRSAASKSLKERSSLTTEQYDVLHELLQSLSLRVDKFTHRLDAAEVNLNRHLVSNLDGEVLSPRLENGRPNSIQTVISRSPLILPQELPSPSIDAQSLRAVQDPLSTLLDFLGQYMATDAKSRTNSRDFAMTSPELRSKSSVNARQPSLEPARNMSFPPDSGYLSLNQDQQTLLCFSSPGFRGKSFARRDTFQGLEEITLPEPVLLDEDLPIPVDETTLSQRGAELTMLNYESSGGVSRVENLNVIEHVHCGAFAEKLVQVSKAHGPLIKSVHVKCSKCEKTLQGTSVFLNTPSLPYMLHNPKMESQSYDVYFNPDATTKDILEGHTNPRQWPHFAFTEAITRKIFVEGLYGKRLIGCFALSEVDDDEGTELSKGEVLQIWQPNNETGIWMTMYLSLKNTFLEESDDSFQKLKSKSDKDLRMYFNSYRPTSRKGSVSTLDSLNTVNSSGSYRRTRMERSTTFLRLRFYHKSHRNRFMEIWPDKR